MMVRASGNWEGSCRFTRQTGEAMEALEILVGKADTHSCPEGSPKLEAIGNEAVQCRRSIAPGQETDTIAGRVRNVYFVVALTNVAARFWVNLAMRDLQIHTVHHRSSASPNRCQGICISRVPGSGEVACPISDGFIAL